jgi:hypothetical protein
MFLPSHRCGREGRKEDEEENRKMKRKEGER